MADKCKKCSGKLVEKRITFKDSALSGFECQKCREIFFDESAALLPLFEKLKKQETSVSVGSLGRALIVRIPKEYSELYGIEKGNTLHLKPNSLSEFSIKKKEAKQ